MQIAGVIAELDRIADRTRFQPKPALGGRAHHDRALAVDQQHRTVEQLLLARQGDRQFLACTGGHQQPPPRQVRHRHIEQFDCTAVFQCVNSLGELPFGPTAQHTIDAQHRYSSLHVAADRRSESNCRRAAMNGGAAAVTSAT